MESILRLLENVKTRAQHLVYQNIPTLCSEQLPAEAAAAGWNEQPAASAASAAAGGWNPFFDGQHALGMT